MEKIVPLSAGTRLGPYQIEGPLGSGGMGEVYRAKDTRLNRTVAIKVLPAHIAADPALRQRFEREARAVSSLDHPHICALYDVGHESGVDFFVMQYLDGETLAARIERGALKLDEALRYAIEIADALDKAHRAGIVHRDLKPGNIMLTKAGTKLLDFGLAKLRETPVAPGPSLANEPSALPTERGLTAQGTILGTFQYMAPEQIEGKEADARTDIFALGCMLYEMVTGKKAFEGKSPASVMAAILEREPAALTTLRSQAPPSLEHIVKRCLAKGPDDRWQSARDLVLELRSIQERGIQAVARPQAVSLRERLAWIVSGLLLTASLATVAVLAIRVRSSPPSPEPVRLQVLPPEGTAFTTLNVTIPAAQLAISPDGHRLAFVAARPGEPPVIWIRPLAEASAEMVPGTEDASYPFWSPDGRALGFFAQGKLKRLDLTGARPQALCDVFLARGGTWNRDGVIVFARFEGGVNRVSATGGSPTAVTTTDASREETSHRWPQFLPDGKHLVYLVLSPRQDVRGIYVTTLDGRARKRLLDSMLSGAYGPPGYLLFVRDTALLAQAVDPGRFELTGEPITLAEPVGASSTNYSGFSVSETGVLACAGPLSSTGQLTWMNRRGEPVGVVGAHHDYIDFDISPDDKRVAAARVYPQSSTSDIWLLDLIRGTDSRFTFDPAVDASAIWAADGKRLVFRSLRTGPTTVFVKPAAGGVTEERLFTSTGPVPTSWSPDGRSFVYHDTGPNTGWDIWKFTFGESRRVALVRTPFNEMQGQISPDGRWLAFTSDESGRWEIYVQPMALSGEKWQISTEGGFEPRWRRDGKELFYLAPDHRLMAVALTTTPSFNPAVPKPLFSTRIAATVANAFRGHYAVTSDGERFLVNASIEERMSTPITVVLNWTAALRR